MNRKWYIYGLNCIIGLVVLTSCNNEGAGCFDKAGKTTTVTLSVADFIGIDIYSNIDVELLTEGPDRVEITTGENLIDGIDYKIEEGILVLNNLNSCFWSTGYTHPIVAIRNTGLEKIIQHGYGTVFTADTLFVNNISLQIEDASGGFDLLIKANVIRLVSNSVGPIYLRGGTSTLNAGHFWGDGILYAKELIVQKCNLSQNGSNRMELNVQEELRGSINNFGDVYLFNQKPAKTEVELTSQGKLVEKY